MRAIVPLIATLQTFVQGRIEQLKEDRDRGASAIEYAGLILIAGVIIVFLVGYATDTIVPTITGKLGEIFGGGGSGN
jgi:Flp pilus assembly pilin Flp